MINIKDNLIGNSWGSMSIFLSNQKGPFNTLSFSLFKMATLNDLMCKQFGIRAYLVTANMTNESFQIRNSHKFELIPVLFLTSIRAQRSVRSVKNDFKTNQKIFDGRSHFAAIARL